MTDRILTSNEEVDESDCALCEGKGEIDGADLQKIGSVGCPECIGKEATELRRECADKALEIERLQRELAVARDLIAHAIGDAPETGSSQVSRPAAAALATESADQAAPGHILHEQAVAALWLLRWLGQRGGLGHDAHRLVDAVLEGRAYIRDDKLYTDRPAKETVPPRELTLHDFGYAPGNYTFKCLDCGQEAIGDKRAARCETCAAQALRENRAGLKAGEAERTDQGDSGAVMPSDTIHPPCVFRSGCNQPQKCIAQQYCNGPLHSRAT